VTEDEQPSLITGLKERDRSAWRAVVDRHLGEVYGFVLHLMGGDRAAAEDLNQETWLEAIDGIDRFNAAQGAFRNWLFGIARRRVALYYRRRASAGNQTPLSDEFGEVAELGDAPVLPQDVFEQVERASVVRAAMLLLPDDRRRTLLWKYVERLSVETIATRMGRTTKATESLLSRAREQLRGLLRGYMTPCDDIRRTTNESSHE
jgi:RNA polymerase sigma-70 factor, ECF subfamily